MQEMNSKRQYKQIALRRKYVFEQVSKGKTQASIAKKLHLNESVISRDLEHLREDSQKNIQQYFDKILPLEFEKALFGLNSILFESWNIVENTDEIKEKIQALDLAKSVYAMRLDLITHSEVIGSVTKFVSEYEKGNNNNKKIDNNSELLHTADASADVVNSTTTEEKVF